MERKTKIIIAVTVIVAIAIIAVAAYFIYMRLRKNKVLDSVAEIATEPENVEAKNLSAFLAMIRKAESGNRYNVIVGGETFTDFSKHPRKLVYVKINGRNIPSTAAGAYQFISTTWDMVARNLGLTDFTPASQDKGAVWLLDYRGALDAVKAGDFDTALRKASLEWASLTYSTADQNPQSLAALKKVYEANGGTYLV